MDCDSNIADLCYNSLQVCLNMINKIIKFFYSFLFIFFIFLITLIILIDQNFFNLKNKLYEDYPNIKLAKFIFSKNKNLNLNIENDYTIKFLPYTQFEKIYLTKKKINFNNEYFENKLKFKDTNSYKKYGTFFIDIYKNDLIIVDYNGNFYYNKNFFQNTFNEGKLNIENIKTNISPLRVFDIFIYENYVYLSYTKKINECVTINVSYATINNTFLKFQNFFNPETCNETGSPGKMQFLKFNNEPGILLSTAEGVSDSPGENSQNINSIFGKIIFLPLAQKDNYKIFSLGHRVTQGLNVSEDTILQTEHGPRGGDEINIIKYNKNYGWPIVSLGERYDFSYDKKELFYKKNHKLEKFEDPLFSFIPSIGISEIIKLSKNFSIYYDDHYLLSSLNDKSIYFIKLDIENNKIMTLEKVFIGERIRDLLYFEKSKLIILALEESGSIGIIKKN